jgi:hypothetical protein
MTRASRAAVGVLALGGLLSSYGCGSSSDTIMARAEGGPAAQTVSREQEPAPPVSPVMVRCGDDQRSLVRTITFNGEQVTEVQCVDVAPAASAVQAQMPVYAPGYAVPAMMPAQLQVVPAAVSPAPERHVVTERRVGQQQAPERAPARTDRSWQKSAIIIGSTAGAGAGVGAVVGGKKGAAIGAAVGGGSAVVWDQATRRR